MAELRRLGGEAGCSVCEQSGACRRSAEGRSMSKTCLSVTQTLSPGKILKLPPGVYREQCEDLDT